MAKNGENFLMFPKPEKGSGRSARKRRKKKLDEFRDLVNKFCLEADRYKCQIPDCGKPACHAHHCFRRGRTIHSWRERPNNRLSLCYSCHDRFENRGTISQEEMVAALETARKKRTLDFEGWLEKNS